MDEFQEPLLQLRRYERKVTNQNETWLQADLKSFFRESWKLFESLFRTQTSANEADDLTVLLETWIISNPKLLSDGFLVLEKDGKKGHFIFRKEDFPMGVEFVSEKGTRIMRTTFTEIKVGEKIRVPIQTEDDQQASLEGLFTPKIAQVAVEFFTRRKFQMGIPVYEYEEDTDFVSDTRKIIFSVSELPLAKTYLMDTVDGVCRLCKRSNTEVNFQWECQGLEAIQKQTQTPVLTHQTPKKHQKTPQRTPRRSDRLPSAYLPQHPTKQKNLFETVDWSAFESSNKPQSPLHVFPPIARPSPLKLSSFETQSEIRIDSPFSERTQSRIPMAPTIIPVVSVVAQEQTSEFSGIPSAPPPPSAPPLPMNFGSKNSNANKTKKFRPFRWTVLPNAPINANTNTNTIWNQQNESLPVQIETKELEALFSLSPLKEQLKATKKELPKNKRLFDLKRVQNVGILKQHLKMTDQEIKQTLLNMDLSSLSSDKLTVLKTIVPNEEERKIINSFRGDDKQLGPVEQFFIAVKDIPLLNARLII